VWVKLAALKGELLNQVGPKALDFGMIGMVVDVTNHLLLVTSLKSTIFPSTSDD